MDDHKNAIAQVRQATLFQFDMAWELLAHNLNGLTTDMCLWRPGEKGLHVHQKDGLWHADWPDYEGFDIGAPSIAWVTWHMLFWWEMVFDHSYGKGSLDHDAVYWPGDADEVKRKLTGFRDRWRTLLESLSDDDFAAHEKTKWPFADRPFYELAAWLNLELIKTASEIGYCRFLHASQ